MENARKMLDAHYADLHIVSIATTGPTNRAFSADTGMAEVLVVARKQYSSEKKVSYSNLRSRPSSFLDASEEAKSLGKNYSSSILEAGYVGVQSNSVIGSAQNLRNGILQLPRLANEYPIPIVTLREIGSRGLYSLT